MLAMSSTLLKAEAGTLLFSLVKERNEKRFFAECFTKENALFPFCIDLPEKINNYNWLLA
jgi:hypothetical protein